MKNRQPIYFLNGKFVTKSKASISLWDLGLLRGYGVFDFIVTYKGGKPFLLKKHLNRLAHSAKLIGLKIPWSLQELEKLVIETVSKNKNGKEKIIRVIITGGESIDGISLGTRPTLAIVVYDRKQYPTSYYKKGVKVITFEHNREFPRAKSLNYIQAVKAILLARSKNAIEAIYFSKNPDIVYEGTQSNLFLIKNRKIATSDGETLPGITRELVIKICKKLYPTKMREVEINELYNADEIFITASNKEVMPVVKVDSKIIGNGKPGPITRKVMEKYQKFIFEGNW